VILSDHPLPAKTGFAKAENRHPSLIGSSVELLNFSRTAMFASSTAASTAKTIGPNDGRRLV
jgi:hypothetical protein